jgi:threonyl-tRNA synthetase
MDYAKKIEADLKTAGIRTEIDSRNETLDKKIRNAEINKVPYCLVIGEREEKAGTVSVRQKNKGNTGALSIADFVKKIKEESDNIINH